MKLYLMRHGEYVAENFQQGGALSKKGINDIKLLANFLQPANLHVSQILHSGKLRAQQTAEIMTTGLICEQTPQIYSQINPQDDVNIFIHSMTHSEEDILVVGHLPFMGRLVSQLLTGNENKEIIIFYPGTLVCLESSEAPIWTINWVLTPDLFKPPSALRAPSPDRGKAF